MGVTLETVELDSFPSAAPEVVDRVAPAAHVFEPSTVDEAAAMLQSATDHGAVVLPWGSGLHQGIGYPVAADVVLSTGGLDRVIAWEPDDLTLVVEAGVTVHAIESMLAERSQTAGLPEYCPTATVGGIVAAGVSGFRRARLGPTRDRMLQVTLVTGDGRVVTGGGTVVKNVSGYDLPRFAAGSLGGLGLIASVCLKLWPVPAGQATVGIDDAERAAAELYRPLAVLSTEEGAWAFLQGPPASVNAQTDRLGGDVHEGHAWPDLPDGDIRWAVSVPPSELARAVRRLPQGSRYVAQHGVGRIDAAGTAETEGSLPDLRDWAESVGGSLVLTGARDERLYERLDPWGKPPPAPALQRRLIAGFDPHRIVNRGRLPGRI